MSYIGNMALGQTFDTKFCTVQSTGAPTTLAGTPVISNYVGNNTTQLTAGITLTVDFDGVTGLHNCRVVATSGNGYATATDNQLVITTGTVNAVSAVGYVIAEYSIEARVVNVTFWNGTVVATPATAGIPDVNVKNAGNVAWNSGAIADASFATTAGLLSALGVVDQGTAQSATGTTLVLRAAAAFADSELNGATILIVSATAGAGQRRVINSYVGSTDTATVDTWTTTPTGTIVYKIFATPPGSVTTPPSVNATQILGTAISTPATAGILDVNVKNMNNVAGTPITTIKAVQGLTTADTITALGANTITAAAIAADAIGASELAADAVTEIVTGVLTTAMTEAYSTDGGTKTLAQALYELSARLGEFSISGTTLTVKKVDGTTSAMTFTLNDGTLPTAITRAT